MRYSEIISELRKKPKPVTEPKTGDTTPHDYNPGWEVLNSLKQRAKKVGEQLSETYQLFVPRSNPNAFTPRDRRLMNLANPYAYDDQGNIKPDYEKWEQPKRELTGMEKNIDEAAPILIPGKAVSPPGSNKPNANFWTSTGTKTSDGWTSHWAQWVMMNQKDWFSPVGYLYKVKPGALILELNSEHDAEYIYQAFYDLGRTKEPREYYRNDQEQILRTTFPWDEIVKHFDGVHHSGFYREGFVYGWDVESTAWFDTSFLELKGEVPVSGYNGYDDM